MTLDIGILTAFHTIISLVSLPLGVLAVAALFGNLPRIWIRAFLIITALIVATGFLFPFAITPAFITGIIASFVLLAVAVARFIGKKQGVWRVVYAGGVVASLYLMVFVTVAQVFIKTPTLGQGMAFGVTQLTVLGLFIFLGISSVRAYRP